MNESFASQWADIAPDTEDSAMPVDSHEYHIPVLCAEIVAHLAPAPGKIFADCTCGGGGHSEAFLAAGATVYGIDQDPEAINFASQRLGSFLGRFCPVLANFQNIEGKLRDLGVSGVDAILADLGVSSRQIDSGARGFSFQKDGPLDMRMSPATPVTAADLVNTADEAELARIFYFYGDEPASRRVAARIVRERALVPFTRTLQLADCIASVLPRKGRTHPATRCFQALRIAVNFELDVLAAALPAFARMLKPGGRVAILTYHSGEDRLVKNFFRHHATEFLDRPEWPAPRKNPDFLLRLVTTRPVVASDAEQTSNPRARSAKLRVAERLSSHAKPT